MAREIRSFPKFLGCGVCSRPLSWTSIHRRSTFRVFYQLHQHWTPQAYSQLPISTLSCSDCNSFSLQFEVLSAVHRTSWSRFDGWRGVDTLGNCKNGSNFCIRRHRVRSSPWRASWSCRGSCPCGWMHHQLPLGSVIRLDFIAVLVEEPTLVLRELCL